MKLRKILSLALVLLLFSSSALADLSNALVPSYKGEDTGITITIWSKMESSTTLKYLTDYSGNTAWAEYASRLGYHVEWTHPSLGSEKSEMTLMLASGKIPDLVMGVDKYYAGGAAAAIADGLFLDLTDMLEEKCPNLWSLFELNPDFKRESFNDDGMFLGFNGVTGDWQNGKLTPIQGYPSEGPVIRRDLLEAVGMQAPETIQEWHDALTAIKALDNAPAVLLDYRDTNNVFKGAYNIGPDFCLNDEGKVVYGPATDAYLAYLTEMHRWYAEGLIDTEYATRDKDAMDALINAGSVAASCNRNTAFHNTQKEVYGQIWDATKYPSQVKGEEAKWRTSRKLNTGYTTLINAALAKDPEKLDACLRFMDFGYSEEGAYLLNCGIYGVDYTGVDANGRVQYINKYLENGNAMYSELKNVFRSNQGSYLKPAPTLFNPAYFVEGTVEIIQLRIGSQDNVLPATTMTVDETTENAEIMTDIKTYVSEMEAKFIMNIVSLDNYQDYLNTLDSMGIARAIEIQQAALDRYNAR